MIEERVGAQYQNWYDRSSVMPSATSLSAFGVIMSGLCQPTLCQPKSCGTRACSKHPATESAWQQAGSALSEQNRSEHVHGTHINNHQQNVRLGAKVGDSIGLNQYGQRRENGRCCNHGEKLFS